MSKSNFLDEPKGQQILETVMKKKTKSNQTLEQKIRDIHKTDTEKSNTVSYDRI